MTDALRQTQFLRVMDRDEAERRFRSALDLSPLEAEAVPLAAALGRVLAADVVAPFDVPGFDRSNVDGFAVRSADTFGASEDRPRELRLNPEVVATGVVPRSEVVVGTATPIATGGMVPRGADAVVMIEHTDLGPGVISLIRPAAPGANVSFAGTDIGRGETILRAGVVLSSRETGVVAALGLAEVSCIRRPRVAVISTGDELLAPGEPARPGCVHDSNGTVLADAVRELGGEPVPYGIVPDDASRLEAACRRAVSECDVVLLSGGTSKGAGDVSYRVAGGMGPPGILAHGVALKPGKPLCLAAGRPPDDRRAVPVVVLPGFPTSAIFTFHEFVAPVLRRLAGRPDEPTAILPAVLPQRVNSERGRTEYVLVGLVQTPSQVTGDQVPVTGADAGTGPSVATSAAAGHSEPVTGHSNRAAYPMGKGSGSVTAFAQADGFITIPRQREYLEAGEAVTVQLLGATVRPADLVVIGSHCLGLDWLLGRLQRRGLRIRVLAVGSAGGLEAAKRGECDLAGVHLLDPGTDEYNRPFLTPGLTLLEGYGRLQGVVYRRGDVRFEGRTAEEAVAATLADPNCVMVNRNRGSGTRVLIDRLLGAARPTGHLAEARSHNAVVAAVVQARADWGVAIQPAAVAAGLGFLPLREERYDFVVPVSRRQRPGVQAFAELLASAEARAALASLGFQTGDAG